jgi:hypothetical protein
MRFNEGVRLSPRGPSIAVVGDSRPCDDSGVPTTRRKKTPFGPHEGRELKLMRAGTSRSACFCKRPTPPADPVFQSAPSIPWSHAEGSTRSSRRGQSPLATASNTDTVASSMRCRARSGASTPSSSVQELYDSLMPGWRPDLERVHGLLLGYDRKDIEAYVARLPIQSPSTHPRRTRSRP